MESMDSMTMMFFDNLEDLSVDLIKNVPWAQDMYKEISQGLEKGFLNWCRYVLGLSRDKNTLLKWAEEYKSEFEKCTCELVANISIVNTKVLNQVETSLFHLQNLCKELRIEMPYVGNQELCLYEELDQLKKRIEEFEQMTRVRKDELNTLYGRQKEVCSSLGISPKILPKSPLPSVEEMEELQKYIEKLESEKYEREEKFIQVKCEIFKLIEELDIKPTSEFENKVLFEDDSKFLVTDLNMKELDKFYKKLVQNKEEMIEEINEKWSKLERLWGVLEIDVAERSNFSDGNQGQTKEVLKSLKEEIKRLDVIKVDNIKLFIEKYRTELLALWDECHCHNDTRDFQIFNTECYTEDHLELFDKEIQKWKRYREENKAILKLLNEFYKTWEKFTELEVAAAGPKRFQNRGGKLLLEEKERNKYKRKIPQIKETLLAMAAKYMEKNGTPFMTWGKTVQEFISSLEDEIEMEKKQKLSARKQQRDQLTPGKSKSNLLSAKSSTQLFGTPSQPKNARKTPEISNKRKIISTPRTEVKKKPKVDLRAPTSEYKKRTKVVSSRVSSERKIKAQRRLSNRSNKENTSTSETSGYDHFEMEMTKRSDSRSTLHYDQHKPIPSTPVSRLRRNAPFTPTNVPVIKVQASTPSTPSSRRQLGTKVLTPRAPKSPRTISILSTTKNNNNLQLNF